MAVERLAPNTTLRTPAGLKSHSYQGQDLYVVEALGGLRDGFFLDSGASDGVSGSNTLLLETSFDWRGICVEPNDQLFDRLARARRSTCVHCCLYDRAGEVQFFEAAGVLGGILDEYDPNLLSQARSLVASRAGGGHSDPVTKPARTIGSILQQLDAPRTIDYWSLDTEGSELAILKSFPFQEYVVRLLTVEHNLSPNREKIRRFLEAHGYRRTRVLGIDDAYLLEVPASHAWRSGAWSRSR